jgi:hypothetical protein
MSYRSASGVSSWRIGIVTRVNTCRCPTAEKDAQKSNENANGNNVDHSGLLLGDCAASLTENTVRRLEFRLPNVTILHQHHPALYIEVNDPICE